MLFKRFICCFFVFFLFSQNGNARRLQTENLKQKETIEFLSKADPLSKDLKDLSVALKENLFALAQKEAVSAEIITNVFIANKTADEKDALNATSTDLFGKALKEVKKLDRIDLELWVTTQYAFYLYTYRKYEETFPLFMSCINALDVIEADKIISPCETYKKIGYFLMTVEDYEKAETYLIKAREYAAANSSDLAAITDNLGLNSLAQNKLLKAETYLTQAKTLAEKAKDELRYAKVLGNMANLRFKQKQLAAAIALLEQDIAVSMRLKSTQNAIFALVMLGKVHLANFDVAKAQEALKKAQVLAQSKTYLQSSDYEINTLILEIAKETNNEKEELAARRKLDLLKVALSSSDGKDVINKVRWGMEKEKLQLSIAAEKAKRDKETLQKTLLLIACAILAVVIFIVVSAYRKKIKNKENEYDGIIKRLKLDKDHSERKLQVNRQTLESYKTYLKEKNQQIKVLEIEMSKVKQSSPAAVDKYTDKMQQLLDSHLMTNEVWTEFKQSFVNGYSAYYQHLKENFPNLTDSNLRIIFLSKLEMNNAEIARILGLTLEGVKKAKQRLRRKYEGSHAELF